MPPIVQVSLDVTSIDEALGLAHTAIYAGVDWLEAGTPLLLSEGRHSVQALRQAFPDVPIVADVKIMDGGGLESEMMFQAGASMVVVMGQAHDGTISAAVRAAKRHGGKVMCDVMLCLDKAQRARQAQDLGVDYIIVHTGYDERTVHTDRSPLADLPGVLAAVEIPVQAVGGLSIEQAINTLNQGAQSVVFGAPLIVGGADRGHIAQVLQDIVRRVKGTGPTE